MLQRQLKHQLQSQDITPITRRKSTSFSRYSTPLDAFCPRHDLVRRGTEQLVAGCGGIRTVWGIDTRAGQQWQLTRPATIDLNPIRCPRDCHKWARASRVKSVWTLKSTKETSGESVDKSADDRQTGVIVSSFRPVDLCFQYLSRGWGWDIAAESSSNLVAKAASRNKV